MIVHYHEVLTDFLAERTTVILQKQCRSILNYFQETAMNYAILNLACISNFL